MNCADRGQVARLDLRVLVYEIGANVTPQSVGLSEGCSLCEERGS